MPESDPRSLPGIEYFYNEPGIEWALHSVGPHLHPGSEDATVALATRAAAFGYAEGGRVLEVASGLGGPSRYLARRFAALVLCVDATPRMHARARTLHAVEGLTLRCPLLLARTERLPLAGACCDAAWSQDALCHMDKPAVLQEVARVLRPGAIFAFTDWIARTELSEEQRMSLAMPWSFPSLLRLAEYVRLLEERGFELLLAEDRTPALFSRWPVPTDQEVWEGAFAARYGQEEIARQRAPGDLWRSLLQNGATGYGMFIARRRPDG